MGRVIVVGSINHDLVVTCRSLPWPGETVTASELRESFGGKGANQACAAAKWGAQTHLIGAIGEDEAGRAARSDLIDRGVEVRDVVKVASCPTGRAIVMVDAAGENSIARIPGANDLLREEMVSAALERKSLTRDDVVLTCGEVPTGVAVAASRACRSSGATHIHNLAPVHAPEWLADAQPLLVLNEIEALQLSRASTTDLAVADLSVRFRAVVITLGEAGAVVCVDDRPPEVVAGVTADVVDTTGAGDAFCGVLAAQLATGSSLLAGVRHAVRAGAFATTRMGARGALPSPSDIS